MKHATGFFRLTAFDFRHRDVAYMAASELNTETIATNL